MNCMTIKRIDDCLSARAGRLFIEECDTLGLVRQFGSPLFVFSEDQLRRNVRRFQGAFQAGWPDGPVVVMPAAKANWLAAIQRILASEGCGCDTYSAGELTMALQAGCPPPLISVNGVPKDEDHIRRSIQVGARLTIDSLEEVDVIERAAAELGRHCLCAAAAQAGAQPLHRAYRLRRRGAGAHRPRRHRVQGRTDFRTGHGNRPAAAQDAQRRAGRLPSASRPAQALAPLLGGADGRVRRGDRSGVPGAGRLPAARRSTSAAGSPSRATRSTPRPTTASRSSTPPLPRSPGC